MNLTRLDFITRDIVQTSKSTLFLFGDNLTQKGYGGQANAMRGEPNAIGIPTKRTSGIREEDYFSDDYFIENIMYIGHAFAIVKKRVFDDLSITTVAIPTMGFGTGMAQLQTRAPRTLKYIDEKIEELEKWLKKQKENSRYA